MLISLYNIIKRIHKPRFVGRTLQIESMDEACLDLWCGGKEHATAGKSFCTMGAFHNHTVLPFFNVS
jgi:hypothetical protein